MSLCVECVATEFVHMYNIYLRLITSFERVYFASVFVQAFDLTCAFEFVCVYVCVSVCVCVCICVCLCVSQEAQATCIPPFFHTSVHLLCGHHHNVLTCNATY